ncbi:MAG: O-antigen ligase family protein [Bosea sp. (in: a-proteobacteria)]
MLWLLLAVSSLAFIEPSPYELVFILTLFIFAITGVRLSQKLIPLVVLLIIFNIGGVFALVPYMDEPDPVRFIAVGVYLMITCIFFAIIMADDTVRRLEAMRRGMLVAASASGLLGLLGYFDVAGLGAVFSIFGRASGTFKDPNLFGPFMVLPTVYVIQRILCGETGAIRGCLVMSIPLAAILFSFSRGAWGNFVGSVMLCALLLLITSPTPRLKLRIVVAGFAGLIVMVLALLAILSVDSISEMFTERAKLIQPYDAGVQGRFGRMGTAANQLLDMPFGYGPLRFRLFWPEDPHNVYLNAFASYGWIGGISYAALILATCVAGWRVVFRPSPWQRHAIVVWSVLFVTIVQGLQIDTDHWRHFYLMLGIIWGLAALPQPRPMVPGGLTPAQS